MKDYITIKDLEVFANHGAYEEETILGQKFLVSAKLEVDFKKAAKTDELEHAVNYGMVCQSIVSYMKEHTFHLLETVAVRMARALLLEYPLVTGITITLKKPWAPIGYSLDTASVTTRQAWHDAYLSLGSNLGDKRKYLEDALEALRKTEGYQLEEVSDFIETEPYGGVEQDSFLNGALHLRCLDSPEELLERMHEIEQEAGRERKIHWGPRTLDLDLLFYDEEVISSKDLLVPHIDLENREFVLKPLCQIAPYLRHPLTGLSVKQLLENLNKK